MSVTTGDFAWWERWRPDWAQAYCVTLLSDISPEQVGGALGASSTTTVSGIDALYQHTADEWPSGYDPSRAVIGMASIDGSWTLMAEVNGWAGVTERLIGPLSPGRTIVSHFRNVNAVSRFHWWHDGRLLTDFELLTPAERLGAEPDALVDDLRAIGISPDAQSDGVGVDLGAMGFALAQRITGVACTPEWFESTDFLVAHVTMPSSDETDRYVQALITTYEIPTTW